MNLIQTKIIKMNPSDRLGQAELEEAGQFLRSGALVAFPTETVYGLGGNALDPYAIKKIYEAKGRPSDNPLIMHISSKTWLEQYATDIDTKVKKIADAFWPGPLTMILKKRDNVPGQLTGGLDSVAIRMPSHPIALAVIEAAGIPIAAPSANISGRPSPTCGKYVIEDLDTRVDMIIDGGDTDIGVESTVLDMTDEIPCILRPGGITKSMIEAVIGPIKYDPNMKDATKVPKAPGMKYKHYSPKANVTIVAGDSQEKIIQAINEKTKLDEKDGKKVGVLTSEDMKHFFCAETILSVGRKNHPEEVAKHLFSALREFDEIGVDQVYSIEFSGNEVSVAVMNRLVKAAGHEVIQA